MFDRVGGRFQGSPSAVQYYISPDRRSRVVSVFARLEDNSFGHRSYKMRDSTFEPQQPGDEWQNLGGVFSSDPVAIAPSAGTALRIFGRGQDNALWVIWSNGSSWFGPEPVGGEFTSGISVVYSDRTNLHVFVRGLNNAIWHYFYHSESRGVAQMGLEDLGGETLGNPAAIATRDGHIHVFVRGLNNGLWRKTWNGVNWTDWLPLAIAGTLHENSDPIAGEVFVPPTLDSEVFVFYHNAEGRIKYIAFNSRFSFLVGQPDELSPVVDVNLKPALATLPGAGLLNIFATRSVGADLLHSHAEINSAGYSSLRPWTSIDGLIFSSPAAATAPSDHLNVFVRGSDGSLWHRWWDGRRWIPE